MSQFDNTEETAVLSMKLLVVLYEHEDHKVLLADRGFDICLLKLLLQGKCEQEETQTYIQRLLAEIPIQEKLNIYFDSIKELCRVKGKEGLKIFGKDIFHPTFIMTAPIREELLSEIDSCLEAQDQKLKETDDDCQFDYSLITPELKEDASFIKIGRNTSSRPVLP